MEETAPINVEPPAAQLPVGAQQEMKTKYLVLDVLKGTLADEAKISHIFLVFHSPTEVAIGTLHRLQTHSSDVLLFGSAISEFCVTTAEDFP